MELSATDFDILRSYIQSVSGIALGSDKMYLVKQRLEPLVLSEGCRGFSEFVNKLVHENPETLRDNIILSITTNETSFFRDIHPFETFEKHLLPKLGNLIRQRRSMVGNDTSKPCVRILSVGSSTGQEPYCIAMLAYEYARANLYSGIDVNDFGILATDISKKVLAQAISGQYTDAEANRGLTPERKEKYFKRCGTNWQIIEPLRNMVRYLYMNINDPYAISGMRFDIIFCRNVLIYFDGKTKSQIFSKLHGLLSDDGVLILGSMENTYMLTDKFDSIQYGNTIVYKKSGI